MPQHKVTFFFAAALPSGQLLATSGALGGWTETFYDPRNIPDTQALSSSFSALGARRALLTPGWRCYLIRVSQWPLTRTAAKMAVAPADGVGQYPFANVSVGDEKAYSVLVVNFSSAAGRPRAWGLRGVANEVVGPNGLYLSPPNFVSRFQFFTTVWAGTNPYAMQISTKQTPQLITGVLTAPIVGVPAAAPATPAIQTSGAALVLVPGLKVRISGAQGMSNLNGTWIVQSSALIGTVATHQLAPKRRTIVTGTYTQAGTMTPYTPSLDNLVTATPGQGGPHKLGRAPFAPRGRRSRRQL